MKAAAPCRSPANLPSMTAAARVRAPSTDGPLPPASKKIKLGHHVLGDVSVDVSQRFAAGLLDEKTVDSLRSSYSSSEPFKHVVIDQLFRDDLLTSVKDECIGELSFTLKVYIC